MSAPPRRLLLIDDDASLREIFEYSMGKAGFVMASAEDGELGLAKIPAFQPDLIVLDLMMPKLNGFEVLHRLQKEGFGSIPVVVITGYSESANQQIVSQEPNVVDFQVKPIRYEELIKTIHRLLDGRR